MTSKGEARPRTAYVQLLDFEDSITVCDINLNAGFIRKVMRGRSDKVFRRG